MAISNGEKEFLRIMGRLTGSMEDHKQKKEEFLGLLSKEEQKEEFLSNYNLVRPEIR